MKSIRGRITIFIGILLIVVCTGFILTAFSSASNALITNVEETMPRFAVESAKTVEAEIRSRFSVLETAAANSRIAEYLSGSSNGYDPKSFMTDEVKRSGHMKMALVDKNGKAMFNDGTAGDFAPAQLKEVFAGNSIVIGPMPDNGKLVMLLAVPLKSGGQTVGALIAYRDGYELCTLAEKISYGKSGKAFIVSKDGRTIAHADKDMLSSVIHITGTDGAGADGISSATSPELASSATQAGEAEASGSTGYIKLKSSMAEGETGFGEYEFNGEKKFMGYAPISGFDWSIGVEVNKSEMLTALETLKLQFAVLTILFIILSLSAAFLIANNISRPVKQLTAEFEKMADGDFSCTDESKYFSRKDEIGKLAQAYAGICESLRELIGDAAQVAEKVSSHSVDLSKVIKRTAESSKEVARAVESIAQGTVSQAEEMVRGTESVNEMGRLIELNRRHLEELTSSAAEVERIKEEGFAILEELLARSRESSAALDDVFRVIMQTNESADRIEDTGYMIRNISEQTNMLALNASIEAASAGAAGRGFVIVAEEIRKLASESNAFTKEITSNIINLKENAENSAETIKRLSEVFASLYERVDLTKKKFEMIASAIEDTKRIIGILDESGQTMENEKRETIGIIQMLMEASEENAAGTEEISASVEEQANAMDMIRATSEDLAVQAVKMNKAISRFRY